MPDDAPQAPNSAAAENAEPAPLLLPIREETAAAAQRRPGKNIVLCADGTGNRGGETPDSNVYRIYKMVELHDPEHEQVKYYDNGVGTAKNKYWRAISGAFGGGFKGNVCDLYQFLARAYDPGDRIFLFGFSRGAATVRAFSGFLATCGLIDGRELHQAELRRRTEAAYDAYKNSCGRGRHAAAEALREVRGGYSHGVVPVEAIGVWDSVAALGLPQDFKMFGLITFAVNAAFTLLDKLIDVFLPHRFHNYDLTPNVRHAFHAVALDDERLTFSPMVYDENKSPLTRTEQVFFAGAHSNVGGGYARNGLSSVALVWMMVRLEQLGLHFEDGALAAAANDINEHGRLVDSRDGLAIYYRYEPRDIEKLCAGRLLPGKKIAFHRSVLERIDRRTANYAPGRWPYEIEVVDTPLDTPARPLQVAPTAADWRAATDRTGRWMFWRGVLYSTFLETSIVIALVAIHFLVRPVPHQEYPPHSWQYGVWNVATYLLPKSLEALADALASAWYYPCVLVGAFVLLMLFKMLFRRGELAAREDARKHVRAAWLALMP